MRKKHSFLQILVLATATVAACMIVAGSVYEASTSWKIDDLEVEGRPRIGRLEARIEMVVVEDFRCSACQLFSEKIFPQIQQTYIDEGRAFCMFVPVAFLDGSKPLANAALAVYKIAPDRFNAFIHAVFTHFNERESNGTEQKELLELAEQIGGIDLKQLQECIESHRFYPQLDLNLEWAKRIMGENFGTPALFIDGVRTPTRSIEKIKERLDKLEKK